MIDWCLFFFFVESLLQGHAWQPICQHQLAVQCSISVDKCRFWSEFWSNKVLRGQSVKESKTWRLVGTCGHVEDHETVMAENLTG